MDFLNNRMGILVIVIVVVAILVGLYFILSQPDTGPEEPIGGETDEHGCLLMAGYTWCEPKQKCLRTWEEDCEEATDYEIVEVTNISCNEDSECTTPNEYMLRSDCPYLSKCIDNKCTVVCPKPEYPGGGEERAREIAKNHIMNLDEYMDNNGRNLEVTNVIRERCLGCWQVELQFDRGSGEETDTVAVKVILENWEVYSTVYIEEGITLTQEECEAQGGRVLDAADGAYCDSDEMNAGGIEGFVSPHICCVSLEVIVEDYPIEEEYCGDMTLTKAREIAMSSECTEDGSLKEDYMCNEGTGTWWIDLDIQREGCNPACVVNVETEEAEINWRCTGLLI